MIQKRTSKETSKATSKESVETLYAAHKNIIRSSNNDITNKAVKMLSMECEELPGDLDSSLKKILTELEELSQMEKDMLDSNTVKENSKLHEAVQISLFISKTLIAFRITKDPVEAFIKAYKLENADPIIDLFKEAKAFSDSRTGNERYLCFIKKEA